MKQEAKYYGICVNCSYASDCTNATNNINPVWFCDLFETGVSSLSPHYVIDSADGADTQANEVIGKENDFPYKGLCMNCEHRHTCIHAKSIGGIWHCNEYE